MKVQCLERAIQRLRDCYGADADNMEFVRVEERDKKVVFVGKEEPLRAIENGSIIEMR